MGHLGLQYLQYAGEILFGAPSVQMQTGLSNYWYICKKITAKITLGVVKIIVKLTKLCMN